MALKNQSQHDQSVHKAEKPQNLKNIIHDINNSLMLIGVAADELERHALSGPSTGQAMTHRMASHRDISSGKASQIVRHHIKQIGTMLQEAGHYAPIFDGGHAHSPERLSPERLSQEILSYQTLASFFELQRLEWSLIVPPETSISLSFTPFEGVVLASRPYMMRLFQNLVRNACEA